MGVSSLSDLSLLGGLTAGIVPVSLLGVIIIVVVGNRAEPDPSGRRPFAVYYFAVSYVAVFALLFSTYEVVHALMSLAGSSGASGDDVARVTVLGLIVATCTGAVLAIHLRRGLALARLGSGPLDPTLRVAQTYVAAVSFLVVLIGVVAAVGALYSVFGAAGPGVFNPSGTRGDSVGSFVDALYLVLASVLILGAHLRLAPPYLRPLGGQPWPWPWPGKPAGAGPTPPPPHDSPAAAPGDSGQYEPETEPEPEPASPYQPQSTWQPPSWEPPDTAPGPAGDPS